MFEDARYRWDRDPDDGEYELQFDRFESTTNHHDQGVFLIVDTEKCLDEEGRFVGDVILSTADVPDLNPDDPATTKIYDGIIEDNKIKAMTFDQEKSKNRHEKFQGRLDRLHADTDTGSEMGH
ncbi:hypothetical protein [Halocatena marina]|uniref:hypothetical protein n=1 Tax=Halocatena marina TaxID=2934937 RepID=UPI00200F31D7|nr:hypothetical protein [Halocatena marina]